MAREQRDAQRSKLYAWERQDVFPTFANHRELTLDECKALAAKMYGARVVVKDGRGCRNASAHCYHRVAKITLPKWARRPDVIAHEIAHWKAHRIDPGAPAHGGIFTAEFIKLLATLGFDHDELVIKALDYGLKVYVK